MTTTAKPKSRFSSRNLSAVFKAPLRSKPLPENVTGPPARANSRMLVLGRSAAPPPAPLNTPSLRKEHLAHDTQTSLVATGVAGWAAVGPVGDTSTKNAEMHTQTDARQTAEMPPMTTAASVGHAEVRGIPDTPDEEVWTPQSVAEHLHTTAVATTTTRVGRVTAENSGRWGDDAVEQDLVHSAFRRKVQQERDFPNLKEAVMLLAGGAHGHHHAPAAMAPGQRMYQQPQEEAHQFHGRASGRWTNFQPHEEPHRPLYDDRRSRDDYQRRSDYPRYHDNPCEDERSAGYGSGPCASSPAPVERSHVDDGLGQGQQSGTHFSRSDARYDELVSGARPLSHSPHRYAPFPPFRTSSSSLERREGRSPSPASFRGREASRSRSRSPAAAPAPMAASSTCTRVPTPVTTFSSPASLAMTPASGAPAVETLDWRHTSPASRESDRVWSSLGPSAAASAWRKDDRQTGSTSAVPALTATSNADATSSWCMDSNVIAGAAAAQQVRLLKRPKMLFDPKTGALVDAEESAGAEGNAGGKRAASAKTPGSGGRAQAGRKASADVETKAGKKQPKQSPDRRARAKEKEGDRTPERSAGNTEQAANEAPSEGPEWAQPDVVSAAVKTARACRREKAAARGGPTQGKTDDADIASRSSRSGNSRPQHGEGRPKSKEKAAHSSRKREDSSAGKALDRRSRRKYSEGSAKSKGAMKPSSVSPSAVSEAAAEGGASARADKKPRVKTAAGRERRPQKNAKTARQPKEAEREATPRGSKAKEAEEGSGETAEGFETVSSRRVVLSEKKQLRQELETAEAKRVAAERSKAARAERSSKGPRKPRGSKNGVSTKKEKSSEAGEPSSTGGEIQAEAGRDATSSKKQQQQEKPRSESPADGKSAEERAVEAVEKGSPATAKKSRGSKLPPRRSRSTSSPESSKPTEQVAGEPAVEAQAARQSARDASAKPQTRRKPKSSDPQSNKRQEKQEAATKTAARQSRRARGGKGERARTQGVAAGRSKPTEDKPRTGDGGASTKAPGASDAPRTAAAKPEKAYVAKTPAPSSTGATSSAA